MRSSVGVGRALRIFRTLQRLKVIKFIVIVVKESKFLIKFLKRISTSERVSHAIARTQRDDLPLISPRSPSQAVRMAVAMVKMRKQHSHLQQEALAAQAIQVRACMRSPCISFLSLRSLSHLFLISP